MLPEVGAQFTVKPLLALPYSTAQQRTTGPLVLVECGTLIYMRADRLDDMD